MRFLIVMGASRPAKLMPKYLNHLVTAGIEYKVNQIDITHSCDGTMKFCVDIYRRVAEEHSSFDRLILCDAWDILTWASREDIEQRLGEFPHYVTFAAERNCWPEPNLCGCIESPSPWKFLNGGMLTGSPEEISKWCDDVEKHPEYSPNMIGQQWLNRRLCDRSWPVRIDRGTRLFYCMQLENGELQKKDGRLWNSVLDTYPLFVHFNGNWPWDQTIQMMEGKS